MRRYYFRRKTRNLLMLGAAVAGGILVGAVVPGLLYSNIPRGDPAATPANTPRQAIGPAIVSSALSLTASPTTFQPATATPMPTLLGHSATAIQTQRRTSTAAPSRTPAGRGTPTPTEIPIPQGMALVPAGSFLMG